MENLSGKCWRECWVFWRFKLLSGGMVLLVLISIVCGMILSCRLCPVNVVIVYVVVVCKCVL